MREMRCEIPMRVLAVMQGQACATRQGSLWVMLDGREPWRQLCFLELNANWVVADEVAERAREFLILSICFMT
jgi:hypothetical protein